MGDFRDWINGESDTMWRERVEKLVEDRLKVDYVQLGRGARGDESLETVFMMEEVVQWWRE